jgi:AraC family transcriptional regulator
MAHLDGHGEPVSFGSVRFRNRTVPGFLVTDARFPASGGLPSHFHERAVIATTFEGAFESRMCGRSYWSTPSMIVVEPAGERHANTFGDSGARVLVLQPDPARDDIDHVFAPLLAAPQQTARPSFAILAGRLSHEVSATDRAASLAIEALALELIASAARALGPTRDTRPAWLLEVRDRLHDDVAATPSLAELARIANVHPGHLTRAFRRAFGCSVGTYLRDLRLQRAAERLASGEATLASIASEAGFADQSHFTRMFRRRYGCTPAAYRSGLFTGRSGTSRR